MAKPAYDFRKRFDSVNDLAKFVCSSYIEDEGVSVIAQQMALKLFNALNLRLNTSPHKLVVECIYLTLNAIGVPTTVRQVSEKTTKLYGFRIRPEPYRWIADEMDTVCKMLKCEPTDLPLRGALGGVMASGTSSGLSS